MAHRSAQNSGSRVSGPRGEGREIDGFNVLSTSQQFTSLVTRTRMSGNSAHGMVMLPLRSSWVIGP